jgi:hypothetical protein
VGLSRDDWDKRLTKLYFVAILLRYKTEICCKTHNSFNRGRALAPLAIKRGENRYENYHVGRAGIGEGDSV